MSIRIFNVWGGKKLKIGRNSNKMSIEECCEWLKIVYPDVKARTITGAEPGISVVSSQQSNHYIINHDTGMMQPSSSTFVSKPDGVFENAGTFLGLRTKSGWFFHLVYSNYPFLITDHTYYQKYDQLVSMRYQENRIYFNREYAAGTTVFFLEENISV